MQKNQQPRRGHAPGENEAERNTEVPRRYLEAVALSNQQRKLVLQEVLSKPGTETLPLAEQEFYELCIEESDDIWRPGFVVTQTRGQWSEIDGQGKHVGQASLDEAVDAAVNTIDAAARTTELVPAPSGIGGPIDVVLLGDKLRPQKLRWKSTPHLQ